MNFENLRHDFGIRSYEVNYLKRLGLREDEIIYLAWLNKKNEISKRRKFR